MSSAALTKLNGLLGVLGQPVLEYGVNTARWPHSMREAFVESGPDQGLVEYLERIRDSRATRRKTFAQRLLRTVMSDFDANALLGMYPMHLFSTEQATMLLGARRRHLLDIGAGTGDVTGAVQPLFERVEVLESSWGARRRLRALGFECHDYDVAQLGIRGGGYDVVSLLNVLDRADRPWTMLKRCREWMKADTRLLLSVPLPYRAHVYVGVGSREPRERLPIVGERFSDALLRLVLNVLDPVGLVVERMTRLPYVSGGDSSRPITVLDAAVLSCRTASA